MTRLRAVMSIAPGGQPFFGFVSSQYHFGHNMGGGLGGLRAFLAFLGVGGADVSLSVDGLTTLDDQSSCLSQGSASRRVESA